MMIYPRDEHIRSIGIEKGKMEEKQEVTKNLLKEGMTIEKISKITGQTQQQIKNPEKIEKNRMINPRDEYNRNIGIEEGKIEEKIELTKSLLEEGMTIEKISKITGQTQQQIEIIKKLKKIENQIISLHNEYYRNIGIEKGKLEVAKNLLKEGMTIEKISKITGLTEQQIENNL